MKKFFLILTLSVLLISYPKSVWAVTDSTDSATTAASSPTPVKDQDRLSKINLLKDKIASKVAELRNKEKEALYGPIKALTDTIITLTTVKGDVKAVVDEDTLMYKLSGGKEVISLKKLKEKDKVVVIGTGDNLSSDFIAKVVYLDNPSTHISGEVTDTNREEGTLSLKTDNGDTWIVDIETYSKTNTVGTDYSLQKSGFSKIKIGDRMHVRGSLNDKESNRLTANRILNLETPGETKSTPTAVTTPTSSPTPSPKPTKVSTAD